MILRPEAIDHHPATLTVDSRLLGRFEAPVKLDTELIGPVDVLWIMVKATQLEAALASVPADRVGDALIVPLLNGIDHMATLRSRYNPDHVIAGTIRIESERGVPGHIRQLSPFADMRLAAVGPEAPRVQQLAAEVRRAGLSCEMVDDEASLLWGKLVALAPLALTTTAKGAPLGEVRNDPTWRARLEACVSEACAVAAAEGARIDHGAILDFLRNAPDGMRSSLQKDAAAGRPLELEAIGGPIVRLGHAHGLDVSTTEELMATIAARSST
jgi:2-dehydropantoate 2-reductase